MIELKTKCDECIHKNVCKYENRAKDAMEKLKSTKYGEHEGRDYNWETMSNSEDFVISFSCLDFMICGGRLRG